MSNSKRRMQSKKQDKFDEFCINAKMRRKRKDLSNRHELNKSNLTAAIFANSSRIISEAVSQ